ncbi:MAG: sigma-54-dependent Fis family transcriptional regulator [Deltaproteobacteria bacterium]|nr:sigma-54-dependent Fis family transcriptional regulator [Deltaproteobacteria bacterium]MBI4794896.1 sigma-54-dependent Fis family transcriptional regulator [Deltaproteobacteria bacterium]
MNFDDFSFQNLSFLTPSGFSSSDIDKIAKTRASILITGERGTGKELFARYIHMKSPRAQGPFIIINCPAKTETFLENEIFGQENVTDFDKIDSVKGKIEKAEGGTLFLNEVGELPIMIQLRLLRVLNEMKFEKVGGTQSYKVDARFIAASSKDLKSEVENGKFREDLFYRLNVVNFFIPPLRNNRRIIPLLIDYFVKKYSKEHFLDEISIAPEANELLRSYNWPGNILELETIIEHAIIICNKNCITPNDLPKNTFAVKSQPLNYVDKIIDIDILAELKIPLQELLERIEELIILKAMEKSDHIQTRAAKILGITKSLLQYKMKKYNIASKSESNY